MIELAEHILETYAGHFDPSEFENRYDSCRRDAQAQAGWHADRREAETAPLTKVVKLMDALRRSIEAERAPP